MAPKQTTKQAITEGMQELAQDQREARKALLISQECHCCCCTGECSGVFEDLTEQEQREWLRNYWENVERWAETELQRLG